MVKKRLSDGTECPKCAEATQFLQSKGVWAEISDVLWYDETQPGSAGQVMAERFGMTRAPFFVVEREGRDPEALDSVMRVYKLL